MIGFKTLMWLEARKHTRLWVILLALLSIWFVVIPKIAILGAQGSISFDLHSQGTNFPDWMTMFSQSTHGSAMLRGILLIMGFTFPGLIGFLAISVSLLGTGKEGRGGQLSFLLMAPQSATMHVLTRFLFVTLVSVLYFAIVVFSSSLAYLPTSDWLEQSRFALEILGLISCEFLIPLCSCAVLSDIVLSSFRSQGHYLLPLFVMLFGWTGFAVKAGHLQNAFSGRYFSQIAAPLPVEWKASAERAIAVQGFHLEPLLISMVISALLLWAAVLVWKELEV